MDEIHKLLLGGFECAQKTIKESKQRFAKVEANLETSYQAYVLKAKETSMQEKAITPTAKPTTKCSSSRRSTFEKENSLEKRLQPTRRSKLNASKSNLKQLPFGTRKMNDNNVTVNAKVERSCLRTSSASSKEPVETSTSRLDLNTEKCSLAIESATGKVSKKDFDELRDPQAEPDAPAVTSTILTLEQILALKPTYDFKGFEDSEDEGTSKSKSKSICEPHQLIEQELEETPATSATSQTATEKVPDKPKARSADFKVPTIPALKPIAALKPKVDDEEYDNEGSEDEDADMSKSIYKSHRTIVLVQEPEDASDYWEEDPATCSFVATVENKYEHTFVKDQDVSEKVQQAILESKGNPFRGRLREAILGHCYFSQQLEKRVKQCSLLKKIPQLKAGMCVACAGDEFKILKYINKGSYGSIYTGKSTNTGKVHAMKQEKPPCLWEYYICAELRKRLQTKRMIPGFMQIDFAIIANNSSILITDFSKYGSIIDVCNKFQMATNRNLEEHVVMVLTSQLLSIIGHLHRCKIIHADIKPDNFLVMSKIEYGSGTPALRLIDFGSAIDMEWYRNEETFTVNGGIANFTCCEMLEKKPWTYQTDLFGIAGTTHAMLFGRYMEVHKKMTSWSIKARFPRSFNKTLWENYFSTLLNVPDCFTMPDLQALMEQFKEFIQSRKMSICNKINEFNRVTEQ